MHHPWRELRSRQHIDVHWQDLPEGILGATDGERIWMDRDLGQVERRCTVTHELVHIELDHDGHQDGKAEDRVRRITAERLIKTEHLIPAARWAMSVEECADELWVTPEVLRDRIHFMSPIEKALVCAAIQKGRELSAD